VKQTLEEYLRTIVITLALLGTGMALQRLKVARPFFYFVDRLVILVLLPAVVFGSIAWQTPTKILGAAVPLAFIGLGVCLVPLLFVAGSMRFDKKESTAIILNSAFMNVTYLGLPLVYILGGDMGPASLYAMAIGIMHLTFGLVLLSSAAKKKTSLRKIALRVLTFPAAFVLIVALLFAFLGPPPSGIKPAFDYLSKPSFVLMLLYVGYKLPLVNPRKYLRPLAVVGIFRFAVCPLVTYLGILAFGLELTGLTAKPALIMAAMPPAVFNIVLAHEFKQDLKLYGTIVLYLTIVSLFVALPLMMFIFGF